MIYLGSNNFIKRWKTSIIAAMEIAAIMLALVITISTYYKQSEKIRPFEKFINSKGVECFGIEPWQLIQNEGTHSLPLLENLVGVEKVLYSQHARLKAEGVFEFLSYGIDDIGINYKPEMLSGRWLTDAKKGELINVAVTENPYGITTGDTIELVETYVLEDGQEQTNYFSAYVCGVIKNGTHIYECLSTGVPGSIEDMYIIYDSKTSWYDNMNPVLFLKSEDMDKMVFQAMPNNAAYIKFSGNISADEYEANCNRLKQAGIVYDFKDIHKNSIEVVEKRIFVVVPILVSLILFVSISIVVSSAISTNRELHEYAIYFVNGMQWRDIVLIKLVESVDIFALGLVLFGIASNIISLTNLHILFEYKFYSIEVIAIIGLFLYLTLIQTVTPYICIRNNRCCDVLRKAKL